MADPTTTTASGEPKRRCTARKRGTDQRCGQPPIPGGTVCRFHGGNAPQVRRSAQGRLAELVMPAIGTLAREMVKAEKSADKQRAANSILDRAGISRTPADDAAKRQLIYERLIALREARDRGESPAPELEVLDAEVVADDA